MGGGPEEAKAARVIAHVDMDCFYVQVEQRKNPELKGLPTAVVQYNSWKGGGLIAVGYEARKFGVKRSMRGDEAKEICPDINLVRVPTARGKADLNIYRSAGSEVVAILAKRGKCERASIDEAYLDLTDAAKEMLASTSQELLESNVELACNSNILGLASAKQDNSDREDDARKWLCRPDADYQDKLLAFGAIIVAQLRAEILEKTLFTCSAGIAHNKMLAKLASGMHKPAQQTVVPSSAVPDLLAALPVKKMKQLGGKLGSYLQADLGIVTVADLLKYSEVKLQELYGVNTGTWLWKISRGIFEEEVQDRLLPMSHGCGKTFRGPEALKTASSVRGWLDQLAEELSERIEADLKNNKRIAHTLTLHATAFKDNKLGIVNKFPSKSCPLRYGTQKIQEDGMRLFESALSDFLCSQRCGWAVTSLSITASKIIELPKNTGSIRRYFQERPSSSLSDTSSPVQFTELTSSSEAEGTTALLPSEDNVGIPSWFEATDNGKSTTVMSEAREGAGLPRPITKRKGTSSILSFLNHGKKVTDGSAEDHIGSTPEKEGRVVNHRALQASEDGKIIATEPVQRSGAWTFEAEDIDPSVVSELPEEIQREINAWLPPSKKRTSNAPRSSISHYFRPASRP